MNQNRNSSTKTAVTTNKFHSNSESKFISNSFNTFQNNKAISDNSNLIKSESGVLVIKNSATGLNSNLTSGHDNNNNNFLSESSIITNPANGTGELVVEQSSKLGILVQVRVLEDKMQAFVTLVNENQLDKDEKRQVFENIRSDYEMLLKNYEEAKKHENDMNISFGNDLDMDL